MDPVMLGILIALVVLIILVLTLLDKLDASLKNMDETMRQLIQQQAEAQRLAQSLRDILQVPKLRGSFSEAILEEMLGKVLPKGIWERQIQSLVNSEWTLSSELKK